MMTQAQLTALQTELSKTQYAADVAANNFGDIVTQLNAQTPTGNHYIDRAVLKNILATNEVYNTIYGLSLNSASPNYNYASMIIHMLNDTDFTQFRLENPAIQQMIGNLITAGIMTAAEVTQLEGQFTAEMTYIAQNILGRQAVIQDIIDAIGTNVITAINAAIAYASGKSATVLQPLYEAWQTKQGTFQQYIQGIQQLAQTLQSGSPVTVPTNADIDAIIV